MSFVSCPYCKSKDIGDLSDFKHQCLDCEEVFESSLSDGNKHSLAEISADYPTRGILGELISVSFKREEKHCDMCGTIYSKTSEICPTFKKMLLDFYESPDDSLWEYGSSPISDVREDIDLFCMVNLGSNAKRLLKKRKKRK